MSEDCCDNNSRIIKQDEDYAYFKCDKCGIEFKWGIEKDDSKLGEGVQDE